MKLSILVISFFMSAACFAQNPEKISPLRIGIAGLTHSHVHWILRKANDGDIKIVGIAESNRKLAERYLKQYNLSLDLLYPSLEEMLSRAKPEAVTAFNSIYEHLETVKSCAPRKIHVMVEKPLAVNLDHALQMESLAKKHGIFLLTNYETTWYGSHHKSFDMIHQDQRLGEIRKIVVHDGHPGPKEIGVNQEFLDWLTDPIKNGGGALMDFGCYGANLITWLMRGEKPISVTAVTQQIKPEIYPKVDDEATILVTYSKSQSIIQASWNWPYNRKDIEVYGQKACIKADRSTLTLKSGDEDEQRIKVESPQPPYHDPFAYLAAAIRGEVVIKENDLSSLSLNVTAMEILEAARKSAAEGKTIYLKKPER